MPRVCTQLCWAYSYRGQRCVVVFSMVFANRGLNSEQQDWDKLSDSLREALLVGEHTEVSQGTTSRGRWLSE